MKFIIGLLICIAGFFGGAFVGIYMGIIQPILTIGEAIDADTLTGGLVAGQIVWFFLRGLIAWAIIFPSWGIGYALMQD